MSNDREGQLRILAIDPGIRHIGCAVLDGSELVYFAVRGRRGNGRVSTSGRRAIIELFDRYAPQVFVTTSRLGVAGSTAQVRRLVSDLVAFAKEHGMTVLVCPEHRVRESATGNPGASRQRVADAVVRSFPYLEPNLRRDRRNQERYWQRVLYAIAVGLAGHEEIVRRRHRSGQPTAEPSSLIA